MFQNATIIAPMLNVGLLKKRELKDIDAIDDYQYHIYIGHFHHVWQLRSGHFNSLNTLHIHSFVEVYIAVSLF